MGGAFRDSLAPALHDPSVLLGSERVAGRLGQRLDLAGQVVAATRNQSLNTQRV